jgi:hypothetical protein
MKNNKKKNQFDYNHWKMIRERGFIKYVYKWNISAILTTLIYFIVISSISWIEIITIEVFLIIVINISFYFEWWKNERKFDEGHND